MVYVTLVRSMACLPVKVQRIIYDRLQLYNCVPKNCVSRDYGGVVLCSGGSYKSICDWFYYPSSLFEADLLGRQGHGDIFAEISGAPLKRLEISIFIVKTLGYFSRNCSCQEYVSHQHVCC